MATPGDEPARGSPQWWYTYFLIADKPWYDALPSAKHEASADFARVAVTEKWSEMQADDARLVGDSVARGAVYAVAPGEAVAAWRERTAGVTRDFAAKHPEVMRRLRAVAGIE
ncbi:MAG TPA: hypothetical protein VFK92_11385 [Burkholderiales bacterium]|nr:hypothetical protein [Burkholderiales bacterium]